MVQKFVQKRVIMVVQDYKELMVQLVVNVLQVKHNLMIQVFMVLLVLIHVIPH
jgi:chemotaxis regulatin CheY-phosphate phosphatase CheZ